MLSPLGRGRRVAAVAVTVLSAYAVGVATGASVAPTVEPAAVGPAGGVLDQAGDRWSTYYAPADFVRFQAALEGHHTGVGIWLRRGTAGELQVASVEPKSPAARAGLRSGDQVVSVAGRPVAHRSVADVVGQLRGPSGSRLSLVVRRGSAERHVALRRAAFDRADVSVGREYDGVVRIRVAAFTRGVGRHVRAAVAQARRDQARGVLLDLRGDPGGLLDEAVETASVFLDRGPVVSFQRGVEPPHVLNALGNGDTAMPLIVLVDGGTASAAEVVAAALQDRDRAVIVGSQTFGKGSVQEPTRLPDGSALQLTVGRYLTPDGRSLEGVGVEPDIEVRHGADSRVAEQRAVEVLTGLLADAAASGRG